MTARRRRSDGDRVSRLLRPQAVAVQVGAIVRLAVMKAELDGCGPDDWQAMEALHQWALRMPHDARLRWLAELGERTDDLRVGIDELRPTRAETAVAR